MQMQNPRRLPRSIRNPRQPVSPSPAEIQERCLAIQRDWSPDERARRLVRHWDLLELLLPSRIEEEAVEAA